MSAGRRDIQARRNDPAAEDRAAEDRAAEDPRGAAPGRVLGENYTRRHDVRQDRHIVKVLPGGHYTTAVAGETLMTVLGSCISACIRDPRRGIGGINHFMLPFDETGDWSGVSARARYGNFAMEVLINDVLKLGGQREKLEVKLFGGGHVLANQLTVGADNIAFVRDYLAREGLSVAAADVGGTQARRIEYDPVSGRARRLFVAPSRGSEALAEEDRYARRLRGRSPAEGSVELFE